MTLRYSTKQLLQTCLLVVIICGSGNAHAASNEELLQIIERLEQRIEQLEGDDAVESMPKPDVSKMVKQTPSEKIQSGPSPQIPFELLPITPSKNPDLVKGLWQLYLNIQPTNSGSNLQPLSWQDVEKEFLVLDKLGTERNLRVQVKMTGDGQRIKVGRDFFLRSRFDYTFAFLITHNIFLDSQLIHTSEQRLTSDLLDIDDKGRIPSRVLQSLQQPHVEALKQIDVLAQFSCSPGKDAQSNLAIENNVLRDINREACLQLTF